MTREQKTAIRKYKFKRATQQFFTDLKTITDSFKRGES